MDAIDVTSVASSSASSPIQKRTARDLEGEALNKAPPRHGHGTDSSASSLRRPESHQISSGAASRLDVDGIGVCGGRAEDDLEEDARTAFSPVESASSEIAAGAASRDSASLAPSLHLDAFGKPELDNLRKGLRRLMTEDDQTRSRGSRARGTRSRAATGASASARGDGTEARPQSAGSSRSASLSRIHTRRIGDAASPAVQTRKGKERASEGEVPDETLHLSYGVPAQHRRIRRRYYILTNAGKPVFSSDERDVPVSRAGKGSSDDEDAAAAAAAAAERETRMMGVVQALISIYAQDGDKLRSITGPAPAGGGRSSGNKIVFLLRTPIYLMAVSDEDEPEYVVSRPGPAALSVCPANNVLVLACISCVEPWICFSPAPQSPRSPVHADRFDHHA